MKSYLGLGFGGHLVLAGVIPLGVALFSGGIAQAGTQYNLSCDFCHKMPPSDSASGTRDAATGAVKGNHNGHAGSSADSCVKCHGPGVASYGTSHRNKGIEFVENINNSPAAGHYSRAFSNQTSVPPYPLGTCSNVNCHFEKTTPSWGSDLFVFPTDCTQCHGAAPSTGSHPVIGSKHGNRYGTDTGSCKRCHPDHLGEAKPFGHATSAANRGIAVQFISYPNSSGSYSGDGLNFLPSQGKTSYGTCANLYCHSNGAPFDGAAVSTTPAWSGSLPSDCTGCHGGNALSAAPMASGKHRQHLNQAAVLGVDYTCGRCHSATVAAGDDRAITGTAQHVDGTKTVVFSGGGVYAAATRSCQTTECHQAGKTAAPQPPAPAWSGAPLGCNGCHGTGNSLGAPDYASGGAGAVLANSHGRHALEASDCDKCHSQTTTSGTAIRSGSTLHINGIIDLSFNPAKAGQSIAWTADSKTCANIQCHGAGSSPSRWGGTACLGCHSVPQGTRAAITSQFGASSHHVQGPLTDAQCYQCHWEANSDGSINSAYHHATPAAPVELVVYGAGARPTAYTTSAFPVAFSNSGGGSWTKSAPVAIDNSGNSSVLTNYQVSLTVPYASGMKSDFSDLRFIDGTNELSYYTERYTTSGSASVWVRVPSIPASSTKSITMYYGNASATTSSNVGTTLIPNTIAAMEGNCSDQANCGYMNTHTQANAIRAYPADIGTRSVSLLYWGSVLDDTTPGAHLTGSGREKFFSRFRFLFIPDVTGAWRFGVDSEGSAEFILNPADRTMPSGETVIASWYGNHWWTNSRSSDGYAQAVWWPNPTPTASATLNVTANQGYWLDYLQETWQTGGAAAVLWVGRPGEATWRYLNAQYYPNMIYSRKYSFPEPTSSLGAAQSVTGSNGGATSVQYAANGTRAEIQKLNNHCLGCHSDQNNAVQPFGDGKTPKQYAWDGTSVAARYAQTGTTQWGKYADVNVSARSVQTKALSAHGNAVQNQGGWDTKGTWPDTRSAVTNVACYDCHNSHGSSVSGTTASYVSATASAALLKDTTAGQGGYSQSYKPSSGGSSATKNAYAAGAGLCFDCHQNATSGKTPWGYNDTYGATQKIIGYLDTDYFGPGTFGAQMRNPYKTDTGHKGGHFGSYTTLSSAPAHPIGGLCTPCHDPHGVSPTLGANGQYAVPLLKGTWVTSPYKEDIAPASNAAGLAINEQVKELRLINSGGIQYHIDQNTFAATGSPSAGVTQTDSQFAGLCLNCHQKASLTNGTNHTWKSKDRIHEAVKGWKTANGTIEHNYTCSKCHAPHNSSLPRLMVTNCLNTTHKGQTGYNPSPVLSGTGVGSWQACTSTLPYICYNFGQRGGSSDGNRGHGNFPGNMVQGPAVRSFSVACHEQNSADESWNNVTPWVFHEAPTGISATPGNMQATISWTSVPFTASSSIRWGTTSGAYPNQLTAVSSPLTITGLANGQTIYFQVGATGGGSTGWSTEYSVTPTAAAPGAATAISAIAGNAQATISWSAGAGATSSNIRYGTATKTYTTQLSSVSSQLTITGLGSTIYYQIGAVNGSGTTWSDEYNIAPLLPPPTGVSATAGNGQATISWTLDAAATSSYILYGPGTRDYRTMISPATSPQTITGLTNGTTIYYVVSAKYGSTSQWSAEYSITIGPPTAPPTVTTPTATLIGSTMATLGANVTADGGAAAPATVTANGTCWGLAASPLTNCVDQGSHATGVFTQSRTGLTEGSLLYYRGYATNSAGTGYSSDGTIYTEPIQPTTLSFASVGSAGLTVNWVTGSSGNAKNVIVAMRAGSAVDADPADGATYTANAAFGGGTQIGASNYVVYKGTGTSVAVTGLSPGTTYYVKVYAFAAGASGTENYNITFPLTGSQATSAPTGPQATVISPTATAVASTTATLGANVFSDGGAAITANGTCWGSTANPTTNCVDQGSHAAGVFTQSRTGLSEGSLLYYRGYATNSAGTAYSSDGTIYTEPIQPTTLSFASVGSAGVTVNWATGSSGNARNVIVVMRAGSAVNADPADGTTYTANAAFGGGTQIGASNYVVYKGTGTSVAVTGLSQSTTYYVKIYAFAAGASGTENYTITSPLVGSQATGTAAVSPPPAPTVTPVSDYYYDYDASGPPTTPIVLRWTAVTVPAPYDSDPVEYNVELNGVPQGWQSTTSLPITVADYSSYTWRVYARDKAQPTAVSPWSSYDTFSALYW